MSSKLRQAIMLAWVQADSFIKRRLLFALALVFIAAVLTALGPVALKYAVDMFTMEKSSSMSIQALFSWAPTAVATFEPGVIGFIIIYLVSQWLARSSGELRWFLFGTADQRLQRNLSRRLLSHIMKLPISFHLDRKTGALNQTLVQGLAGYSIILQHILFTILPVLVEITLVGIVLFTFFSPEFFLILAASVIGYTAAFALGVAQIVGPSQAVSTAQVNAYASLTDNILNTETVKYFTAERRVNDQYDITLAKSESKWKTFYWYKTLNGLLVALVFGISLGAALWLGAEQVLKGTITVGDFVLINTYMLQIVKPMETLGSAFKDIAYGMAFIEKMNGLMIRDIEGCDDPVQALNPDGIKAGELVFDQVAFSYLPQEPILKNVSFKVASGKTTGIVGSSGAGKSSVIRLLMRFFEADAGTILLNGTSTRNMPLETLRNAIAIVPQDTVLFNNTIAYNIGFGKQGCTQQDIEQAARLAHIHDKILAMTDGYQTVVGERGLKLSGGEKQRVSIARAALRNPQVFVFDEATSSLDTKTEKAILTDLITVSKGVTTLIIAHRLSTVVHADEILVFDKGQIIERGPHSVLLQKNGLYASMWRTQQMVDVKEKPYKESA